ncbi:MAG: signal peptidase II [Firmicutes bacterium]|nr:signal peptidase II [Bacillota bacterium]MCL2256282.1 signal peptidase II [Bacillota bacterium]
MEQIKNFYNNAKPKVVGFVKKYYPYIIQIAVFVGVLLFDLITKSVAANRLDLRCTNCGGRGSSVDFIPNFLRFLYTHNYGVAFGMLGSGTPAMRAILVIVTTIMAGGFVFAAIRFRRENMWSKISFSLIIAGALGNIFDRMFLGYVRDFLQFDGWIGGWFSFIFNIADVALIVGVLMLAVWIIVMYRPQKRFVGPIMPKDWTVEIGSGELESNENDSQIAVVSIASLNKTNVIETESKTESETFVEENNETDS